MSKKKLLIDNYAFVKSKSTLTESEDKKGDYIIEGEFGMVDAKNANNRIYPKEIMERDPHAKVVLITASDDQKIINQCLEIGAISCISKPFDFNSVLKQINDTLV